MFIKRTLIAKLFCTNMTYPMSLIMTIFDMPSYYESHNIKYGSAKVFFDCKFFLHFVQFIGTNSLDSAMEQHSKPKTIRIDRKIVPACTSLTLSIHSSMHSL